MDPVKIRFIQNAFVKEQPSSVNFCLTFLNLSHETVPLTLRNQRPTNANLDRDDFSDYDLSYIVKKG
jgi:hypothetical protein